MSLLQEFKKFAMRGNVIDLAVGVIIGAAFGKIVTSLVNDIFMPFVSLVSARVDFKKLFFALDGNKYATLEEASKAKAPILAYGNFIQNMVEFVIIAFIVFMLVRQINKLNTKPAPTSPAIEPTTKECPFCFSTISLKAKRCPQCTSQL